MQALVSPNPTIGGNFGIALVNTGDVNGDGADDILVGTDEHGGSEGEIFVMSGADGSELMSITAPDPNVSGTLASFGSYVSKISDLGSCPGGATGQVCPNATVGAADGTPDMIVSALGVDVSFPDPEAGGAPATLEDAGRAYLIDGATGVILKKFQMPDADLDEQQDAPGGPKKPAFGRTVLNPSSQFGPTGGAAPPAAVLEGDLNGGGEPDFIVGASDYFETGATAHPDSDCASDPANECLQAGRVYVFYGENVVGSSSSDIGTPDATIKNPWAQADDLLTPVNSNRESMGYSVAPVGDIGKCNADPGVANVCPNASSTGTPDGLPDLVISSHRTDEFGMFDVGVALLLDGQDLSLLYTYHHPEPQPASIFAFTNYNQPAIGDVGSSATPDVYLPAMRQNNPFTGGGRGYLMNGAFKQGGSPNSISFATLNDPTPHPSEDFGTSSAGIGDVAGDTRNEILVGAYGPHNPGTFRDMVNDVHIFSALSEQALMSIRAPDGQPGAGFGNALAPMGDLNGDGALDIAVGAGLYDGAVGADQGRIYIFRSDLAAPTSTITRPDDGASYHRGNLLRFRGTATDGDGAGVAAVQVALRQRLTNGKCRWWNGSFFVPGACDVKRWRPAVGGETWRYDLPHALRASVGTNVRNYTLLSRARDEGGTLETDFDRGRNRNTFEVRR